MLPVLAHIADAAPSNDEMFGFFIVFALLLFVFAVAKLFGSHDGGSQVLSQADDGGGSFLGKIVLGCVVIGVIFWIVANVGTTPH